MTDLPSNEATVFNHPEFGTVRHSPPFTFGSPEGTELPGKVQFGGYLYVIEFSNETIKVGRTQNPRVRLGAHQQTAQAFGASIVRGWLSPHHEEYEVNEKALILRTEAISTGKMAAEYFTGIRFQDAIAIASQLTFTTVDFSAHEEEAKQRVNHLKEKLEAPGSALSWGEGASQAVAELIGRRPDGSYAVPDDWGDVEIPEDLAAKLHELGLYEEFTSVDYVDFMENALTRIVRMQAIEMRAYLLRSDRLDLVSFPIGRIENDF